MAGHHEVVAEWTEAYDLAGLRKAFEPDRAGDPVGGGVHDKEFRRLALRKRDPSTVRRHADARRAIGCRYVGQPRVARQIVFAAHGEFEARNGL